MYVYIYIIHDSLSLYIYRHTKRLSRFSIILERLLGMASSWGLAKMPSPKVGPQSEQIRKSSRESRGYPLVNIQKAMENHHF